MITIFSDILLGANYAINDKNAVFARISKVEALLLIEFYSLVIIIPIQMIQALDAVK